MFFNLSHNHKEKFSIYLIADAARAICILPDSLGAVIEFPEDLDILSNNLFTYNAFDSDRDIPIIYEYPRGSLVGFYFNGKNLRTATPFDFETNRQYVVDNVLYVFFSYLLFVNSRMLKMFKLKRNR